MKFFTHHTVYVWIAYSLALLVLGLNQWQTRNTAKSAEQRLRSP